MRRTSSVSTTRVSLTTMPAMPHTLDILLRRPPVTVRLRDCRAARFLVLARKGFLPLLLLALLLQENEPDGDKNKIEDQKLRTLAIGRADVALKDGVGERQHRDENQDWRNLPQA